MNDSMDDRLDSSAANAEERAWPTENIREYDVVKAAPSYAGASGLISGFALAAVVLVLTVAASEKVEPPRQIYLSFATSLFTLGFVGCLFCAFSFASLGGEKVSPAAMTYSMLVGSGVLISLIAVLGGFEALSKAFLPGSRLLFIGVTALAGAIAPLFVWSPHWDIVQRFGASRFDGPPRSTEEARRLIIGVCLVGAGAAGLGVLAHCLRVFGRARQWEYYVVTAVGLLYVGLMVAAALYVSTLDEDRRTRATIRQTWMLAGLQSATVFVMLALLP